MSLVKKLLALMTLVPSKEIGCNLLHNGEIDNITTGNDESVDIPCNKKAIGTFHTHTDGDLFSQSDIKSAILNYELTSLLGVKGCIYGFDWINIPNRVKRDIKTYRNNLRRRSLLAKLTEYVNSHTYIMYE